MSNVKRNFIYNSLYQILIYIIPLITTPYISRVLGAEKIGIYSYASSVAYYFVMFIILGLNNYGNRTIAEVKDNKDDLSDTFCNIYCMQLILGILITGVYIIYSFCLSTNKQMAIILIIYVFSSVIDINWFYFGMELFKITVMRNTIIKISTTLLIFLLVKNKNDVCLYALILSIGTIASQLFLWLQIHKFVDLKKPKLKKVVKHIKPNLILFIPIVAISLYKIMDKIMLGLFANNIEVGYYESAERLINIPIGLITALGTVMLPRITNMLANNRESEIYKYLNVSLEFALAISSAMSFGIISVSELFVPIFYGTGFDKCVELFYILMPSTLFLATANVIRTQYLIPKQKDRIYITSVIIGAIVNIIINLIAIPKYYSLGAAFGTLLAEASVCFYQFYKTRNELSYFDGLKRGIFYIILGLVMMIVLKCIRIKINIFILFLIRILLGIIIFMSGVIIFNRKQLLNKNN